MKVYDFPDLTLTLLSKKAQTKNNSIEGNDILQSFYFQEQFIAVEGKIIIVLMSFKAFPHKKRIPRKISFRIEI